MVVTFKRSWRIRKLLQASPWQSRALHVHRAREERRRSDAYLGTLRQTKTSSDPKECALAIRDVSIKRRTSEEVRSCIQNCISRADEFPPRGLAMVCLALARIRAAASYAFETFASATTVALGRYPDDFNEQDVSNIANAFAKARHCSEGLFAALSLFLEARAPLQDFFSSQGLANTLNAYAALSVSLSRPLQRDFEHASAAHIFDLSAAQLSNVLNSFARLQMSSAVCSRWDRWNSALDAQLANFTVQGISNSLNGLVRLSVSEPDFFQKSLRQLESYPPKDFKEQEVANILNAYARVSLEDDCLVHFLGEVVLEEVLPSFTSQGLANTTLALSRLPHTRRSVMHLGRECSNRTGKAKLPWSEPHHIINTMFAFAIFGLRAKIADAWHDGFFLSMLRCLLRLIVPRDQVGPELWKSEAVPKLSPDAVSQLYAVLCEFILRRADVLPQLRLYDLAGLLETVELCDPEVLLKSFNDGLQANIYVEKSRFHMEVSGVVAALDPNSNTIFDEAFIPPYVVDILIGPRQTR